jgi:hypothetical protein
MTWFGGNNMLLRSPSIQRLLEMSQKCSTNIFNAEDTAVILWVRIFDKKIKSFLPYTCLGRVDYVSHDANSHPLSFLLSLRDYNDLVTDAPHCPFSDVLRSSGRIPHSN